MIKGKEFGLDTCQAIYSSGKSVASILMAKMVDEGKMQYQDQVGKHWKEFVQNGKEQITVEDVLRHESGLQKFSKSIKLEELLTDNIK